MTIVVVNVQDVVVGGLAVMLNKAETADVPERDFFKVLLEDLVCHEHPLVALAQEVDWSRFDELLADLFSPNRGRYSCPTRLMVGLLMLKELSGLSDRVLLTYWTENPYWQYFTGGAYFEHQAPTVPSSLNRWRHRLQHCGGYALLEEMLGDRQQRRQFAPVWADRREQRPRRKAASAKAASVDAESDELLLPLQ